MISSRPGSYRYIQFLAALLLAVGMQDAAPAAEDARSARSNAGFESERAANERQDPATLKTFDVRPKTAYSGKDKQHAVGTENVTCCAYRIYSTRTQLFDDMDHDGFFSYLRVSMDIDTDYFDADLFLQVYLRGTTGGWLQVFDSDVFTIYGSSGLDDYEVETELLSGFASDYYDVLIEVYDAYTGDLVLEYGPAESPALSLLAMEDIIRDSRPLPPIAFSSGGGGGTLSLPAIALLLSLALWHRSRATRTVFNTRLSRLRRLPQSKD
ncbi:MAG: choice-of-anchor H family protein [Gammaproteobacteria bacterium]|nr:choice-of-anchor H family protein [Gammaproteobacteria bacterium]